MLYFSSLLTQMPAHRADADALLAALDAHGEDYRFLAHTKNIWARDYMPVKTRDGYVSFRYAPSYQADEPQLVTDYRRDMSPQFSLSVTYSDICLDGGNVVLSPLKRRAIVSDRVFSENPAWDREALISELATLLAAEVVILPSLASDFTGHADGMVRFLSEDTVLINQTAYKNGLEQRQAKLLTARGLRVVEFPYTEARGISAEGSYLNFLETPSHIFLPTFSSPTDSAAVLMASHLFSKAVVPVRARTLPKEGGVFNCISWED